jgi:DNA-binding HxlR family transcriptional regulator
MAERAAKPLKVATPPKRIPREAACAEGEAGCQIGELFRILGKAHMLDILYIVMVEADGQPRRFVDLQNALRISPNTLSERLRELVAAGLLTRTAYNEIPPRVDYQVTEKARDLEPVFETLRVWAGKHNLKPIPVEVGPTSTKGLA